MLVRRYKRIHIQIHDRAMHQRGEMDATPRGVGTNAFTTIGILLNR